MAAGPIGRGIFVTETIMFIQRCPGGRAFMPAIVITLTLSCAPAIAEDTEFILEDTAVAGLADSLLQQIEATCIACAKPIPLGATPVTSQTIAFAIGHVGAVPPSVGGIEGYAGGIQGAVASCSPFLEEFLADTEYLGPLLDYRSCLETQVPVAITTPPAVSAGVKFLAAVCLIETSAQWISSSQRTLFGGTTDCDLGSGETSRAFVEGHAPLWSFLYDQRLADAAAFTGAIGRGSSSGSLSHRIQTTAKIRFHTQVRPIAASYPSVAGYTWIVLPNKNPDTGAQVSCQQLGADLNCTVSSIPLTADTIYGG